VFAEDHLVAAQNHVDAAVAQGEAGHTHILIEHAKAALEQTLAVCRIGLGILLIACPMDFWW
ncbi:MAG TPA: small metal-binding protein SmbP, partial [Methylobacter sp.]